MDRRTFLITSGAGLLAACQRPSWFEHPIAPQLHHPGQEAGHWLHTTPALPRPTGALRRRIAILGSGIAGLTCAWQLARSGCHDFVLVNGPESNGNAAAGQMQGLAYPRGAHYLPLPSMESRHVRELLFELGILEADPFDTHPRYDESALVHAPAERLLKDGTWEEHLLPKADGAHTEQHARFMTMMADFGQARGHDGKKAFAIPLVLSSTDPGFRALDALNMKQWLTREGFDSPHLHWYCDYACRDDFGSRYDQTSAWAGIHYFAARVGLAANAEAGAVLTWPAGLGTLAEKIRASIDQHLGRRDWALDGFAMKVRQSASGTQSWVIPPDRAECTLIEAQQVVLAMPAFVAARVLEDAERTYGLTPNTAPTMVPWLVTNVCLEGFPRELPGAPLAWDNVIYGSSGLGYVVSTHQGIRQGPPSHTLFTSYHALADQPIPQARRWLHQASPEALSEVGLADLLQAYPRQFKRRIRGLEFTLRGHAMSHPQPGFLSDPVRARLREPHNRVHFAHADLTGMSLFEEAAYWGYEVAKRLIG